ncbi:hypothetical protein BDF14DRAFT_1720376 [Spinellus fusiger]|nr:hypothetical protein BDF14DRAFT_1720376 [Spinellus fusiger]
MFPLSALRLSVKRLAQRYISDDASRPFPSPFPTRPAPPPPSPPTTTHQGTEPNVKSLVDIVDATPIYLSKADSFRQHHFDTYNLLTELERQGFTRSQAEVFMKGIKFRLRESAALVQQRLLLRSDLENESYLLKAALSELRTEVQIMRRNDTQMLQVETSTITREVEALAQRLSEDIALMKNEVTLDMNNRKNETREEQKDIDMRIQEINNKFTIQLGDVRTDLEAVRWETIWKGMVGVATAGLGIASLGYILTRFAERKANSLYSEKQKKLKQLQEEARHAGTADMEVVY